MLTGRVVLTLPEKRGSVWARPKGIRGERKKKARIFFKKAGLHLLGHPDPTLKRGKKCKP